MRLLIAGSRSIKNYALVDALYHEFLHKHTGHSVVAQPQEITIIGGGAPGVDTVAETIAHSHHHKFEEFPAYWDEYGQSAGYKRNVRMRNTCTHALIVWDGESKGTKHMIDLMTDSGKPFRVVTISAEDFNE